MADWKIGVQYQNNGYPYLTNVEAPNKFNVDNLFTAPYPNKLWGILEEFNNGYPLLVDQADANKNTFEQNNLFTAPYPNKLWGILKEFNNGYPMIINQTAMPRLEKVEKPTWSNGIINWTYPGNVEDVESFELKIYMDGFIYNTYILDKNINSYDFYNLTKEAYKRSFKVTVQALGHNIAFLDGGISEMSDGSPILDKEINIPTLETITSVIWQNGIFYWNYLNKDEVVSYKIVLYKNGFLYDTYYANPNTRSYDFNSILEINNYYEATVQPLGHNIAFLDGAISKKAMYFVSRKKLKTIKVYESDYKQNIGDLKAVIVDIFDDALVDELNGSYTFQFSTVIDDEKSQYLTDGNIVEVEEEYFRIVYTEENRNSDDTLTITVQTEHVNYDLMLDDYKMDYFTSDGTAFDMLLELLSGTEFNIDFVDDEFNVVKTISAQEPLVKRDALFLIAAAYQAEVVFNKFTISLVKKRGKNRGLYFAYRKNIKEIQRIVDGRKRVNNQPTVSYSLSIALLKELLGEDEHFEVGDVVKIYDYKLGIDIETRILSLSKSIFNEIDGDVEIGNFIPDFIDSVNQIERSTVHKGRVYNGIKISAEDGFVAERSDKMARNTMNATFGNKLELGDGEGNYTPVFYVTIENNEAKLNLKGLIKASEFIGGKIIITNETETERVILSVLDGFRFQAFDENAGEEGEWKDSIWMEDGKGKFFGEIISSTITGGLIRTAESGRRVEISENQIRCYNDDGNLNGFVTNNTSSQFGDWEFYDNGNLVFRVYNSTGGQGVSLIPENNSSLLIGSSGSVLGLLGNIVLNGSAVDSLNTATAGATYTATEQQMLQDVYDKLKELLDRLNNN